MKFMLGGGIVALMLVLALLLRPQLDAFGRFVRRLSNLERAFLAGFLVLFVAYGGTKPPTPPDPPEPPTPPEPPPSTNCTMSVSVPGWHEVSFPVLPEGGKPEEIFSAVVDQIGYVARGSANWSPTAGGTLTTLEIGKGYWLQTTASNVVWTVTGQDNPDVEIALKPGWNLIGYPLLEEGEIATVLATALATGNIRYICSGTCVFPGTLTTLTPGKGYWVYAEAEGTVRFAAP